MKNIRNTLLLILVSYPFSLLACLCANQDFNSTEELENYKFIGLVKIDSVYESPRFEKNKGNRPFYEISFQINELYKGDSVLSLDVKGGNRLLDIDWTSCDLGIRPGDEWILFAIKTESGKLRTGSCMFSTKIQAKDGYKGWFNRHGFNRIEKLRNLFDVSPAIETPENGTHKEYYDNGALEVEEAYKNGKLNGKKTVFYPEGNTMLADSFYNGRQTGKSLWYYLDGTVFRDCDFLNGHQSDSCTMYYENGNVLRKAFYSKDGVELSSKGFSPAGNLGYYSETLVKENERKHTRFFDSGEVQHLTISEIDNYSNRTSTQYYKSGQIERIWIYFDTGEIRSEAKKYNKNGDLVLHNQILRDGTRVEILKTD